MRVLDCATLSLVSQWNAESGNITVAAANEHQLVLSLGAGVLVLLEAKAQGFHEIGYDISLLSKNCHQSFLFFGPFFR